jgi:hypothetical protein
VQRAFLKVWTSQPGPFPTFEGVPELASIHAWVSSYYSELAATLGTFDQTMLTRPIEMPGLGEYEERMAAVSRNRPLRKRCFRSRVIRRTIAGK